VYKQHAETYVQTRDLYDLITVMIIETHLIYKPTTDINNANLAIHKRAWHDRLRDGRNLLIIITTPWVIRQRTLHPPC